MRKGRGFLGLFLAHLCSCRLLFRQVPALLSRGASLFGKGLCSLRTTCGGFGLVCGLCRLLLQDDGTRSSFLGSRRGSLGSLGEIFCLDPCSSGLVGPGFSLGHSRRGVSRYLVSLLSAALRHGLGLMHGLNGCIARCQGVIS